MSGELPWPREEEEWGAPWQQLLKDRNSVPPPDRGVFSGELLARVGQAAERLHPDARQMFLAHYLRDVSLQELAAIHNRTPDAVGKVLKRACASVRATLRRQGITDADLEEYLTLIQGRDGQG